MNYSHILKDSAASAKAWLTRDHGFGGRGSKTGLQELYSRYNDPNATVASVLKSFSPRDVAQVVMMQRKLAKQKTSKERYAPNGVYSKARTELHKEIIDSILSDAKIKAATPKPGEKPTFIILGGRGGSGKSAFTNGIINEFDASKFINLNSDTIKEKLIPPYEGWNAASVHAEASDIFDAITYKAHALGLNIIHDSTMRSDGVGSTIAQMKTSGYKVQGYYMFLPRQDAAKRAIERFKTKKGDFSGRLVPPKLILGNTDNEKNFDALSKYFDKWSTYSNLGSEGSKPTLIKRGP